MSTKMRAHNTHSGTAICYYESILRVFTLDYQVARSRLGYLDMMLRDCHQLCVRLYYAGNLPYLQDIYRFEGYLNREPRNKVHAHDAIDV